MDLSLFKIKALRTYVCLKLRVQLNHFKKTISVRLVKFQLNIGSQFFTSVKFIRYLTNSYRHMYLHFIVSIIFIFILFYVFIYLIISHLRVTEKASQSPFYFLRLRETQIALPLPLQFFTFTCNAKSFAAAILFFLLVVISGRAAKSFFRTVLPIFTQEACDQEWTYFIGQTKKVSVEIGPLVVI